MFSQVFIRSTTWRLNSTVCRRHFAILAKLPPFDAKCVYSPCLTLGVQSTRKRETRGQTERFPVFYASQRPGNWKTFRLSPGFRCASVANVFGFQDFIARVNWRTLGLTVGASRMRGRSSPNGAQSHNSAVSEFHGCTSSAAAKHSERYQQFWDSSRMKITDTSLGRWCAETVRR